jgi:hypothetical protein
MITSSSRPARCIAPAREPWYSRSARHLTSSPSSSGIGARLGLDGRPRPIHLAHGLANIEWGRTTDLDHEELGQSRRLRSPPGTAGARSAQVCMNASSSRRAAIGLPRPVPHDTHGGVNVLNLVQGDEIVVESPSRGVPTYCRALRRDVHRARGRRRLHNQPAWTGSWGRVRHAEGLRPNLIDLASPCSILIESFSPSTIPTPAQLAAWQTRPSAASPICVAALRMPAAYASALAAGNPLRSTASQVSNPAAGEGDLHYGIGCLMPGKIGDEYFLTRGHLHAQRPAAEFYFGLNGEG